MVKRFQVICLGLLLACLLCGCAAEKKAEEAAAAREKKAAEDKARREKKAAEKEKEKG